MPRTEEWTANGRFFDVTVFSDVSTRDGLGWTLDDIAPSPGRGRVHEIFREDSGDVPTIAATFFQPTDVALTERFAKAAVLDLLNGVLRTDRTDWLPTNIARALSLAGRHVSRWWGPEWPLTEHPDQTADSYAAPGADAVPFAWLRLALDTGNAEVGIYQDDSCFGLRIDRPSKSELADYERDYFRLHEQIDLPTGLIESVTLTLDTTASEGPGTDALLAEVVLTVAGQAVPLIAAEAYGPNEWHRHDESVVVLRDLVALGRADWIPPRPQVPEPFRSGGSS